MNPLALRLVVIVALGTLCTSGVGGCASDTGPQDPGVPKEAALLPPGDRLGMPLSPGERTSEPEAWQPDAGGALYVVDGSAGAVAYSGPVEAGDAILIYPTGVAVAGKRRWKGGKMLEEKRVAIFEPGKRYRVYFQQGATPVNPTQNAVSPLSTRPYQIRDRVVDPGNVLQKDDKGPAPRR